MLPRTIAVNSNCYHGYSIEEAVHGIVAAGFHELTATKGWTEHVFPDMSLSRLLRTRRLLEEAGLTVVAMSGHVNLMDEERIADFVDNIELAHFLSAPVIGACTFPLGPGHRLQRRGGPSEGQDQRRRRSGGLEHPLLPSSAREV